MPKAKEAQSAPEAVAVGRKRDETLGARILESAIDVLAETGFAKMTMDMVAARAKAGKAALYRRWPSKGELVRDAVIWMSRSSVDLSKLPDTGSLRSDLLAVLKPYSKDFGERKLQVLAGLGAFFADHQQLADEATAGIFEPWTAVNRKLMQRAIERGELSKKADIDMACEIIVSLTSYRTLRQNLSFDKKFYATLLDNILLPALEKAS